MNNSCTVCQCNILVTYNIKCFFILFLCTVCRALIKRLILFSFQFCSFICLKHFISGFPFFCQSSKNCVKKGTCHIINISIRSFYFRIIFFRIYTKCKVRRQCPRSCRPCKDVCILVFYLKSNDSRTFFHILVSLSNFLC